jgi:hypothetical protein
MNREFVCIFTTQFDDHGRSSPASASSDHRAIKWLQSRWRKSRLLSVEDEAERERKREKAPPLPPKGGKEQQPGGVHGAAAGCHMQPEEHEEKKRGEKTDQKGGRPAQVGDL